MSEIEIVASVCASLVAGLAYLTFCAARLSALEANAMDQIAEENRKAAKEEKK